MTEEPQDQAGIWRDNAALLNLTYDSIFVRDMNGRILFWNRGAEETYGWSKAEALEKVIHVLLSTEFPKPLEQIEADVLENGRWEGELVHRRRDGAHIIVASRWVLQRDAQGAPVGILETNNDITSRKHAEEVLRESEERNRAVLDTANEAFIAMDAEGRITDWNHQAEVTFGWSRVEAIGRLLAETIIPPQHREAHRRGLQHFLATGQGPVLDKRFEITALRRDGHEFPVELTIAPIRVGPTYIFNSFLHDITARKQAQEALQESEQRFRLLVEGVQDYAIFMLDPIGQITSWNSGAERIKGYQPQEIIGQHFSCFFSREDVERGKPEQDLRVATAEGRCEDEGWRVRKDGSRFWANVVITALRNATGNLVGFSKVTRDVTARKQAEDALERQKAELTRANTELAAANKELEAFTYSVSHDLRAPLRHVGGFSQILVEEFGPRMDPAAQQSLRYIQKGVQEMGQLIDDLLNLGRIGRQALREQPTELNLLVAAVLADLKPETEKRQIEWQIGQLPTVKCDPGLVKLVFANLLSNAVKFSRRQERAIIQVGQMSVKGEEVFFVRDNGVGFNMRYVDKLFGIFQRLHRQDDFEGTGVGLANVRRIIHKHGGRVWAEAEPYKGAAFYFTLGISQEYSLGSKSMVVGEA
jgi:PAS domain S-box-containing protein